MINWEYSRIKCTYRRFEVGADATDARADNPGSDGGIELHPGKPPLVSPSPSPDFSPAPGSGRPEYSTDDGCGSIEDVE